MRRIQINKIRPWLDPIKAIGYIALIPYILLTIGLKGISQESFIIWCLVSILMIFGMAFYFIVGPYIFDEWKSDYVKRAFRPYRIGGLLVIGTLLLALAFYIVGKF
jgi:hypothetical protein